MHHQVDNFSTSPGGSAHLNMTLTSPYFLLSVSLLLSLSLSRKHVRTCHLCCSAFLTPSKGICSPHKCLKESPNPEGKGQMTSYTPLGTGAITTHHLPKSSGLDFYSSVLHHLQTVYNHKPYEDLQWHSKLWGKNTT